jgi:hypothetical protein
MTGKHVGKNGDDAEIIALCTEWIRLWRGRDDMTADEVGEANVRREEVENRIFSLRATTAAAIAAKVRMLKAIEDEGEIAWFRSGELYDSIFADLDTLGEAPART